MRHDVDIQLPLSVAIPTTYIPDVDERTQWYQRLTRAKDISQLNIYKERLQEQYGELPAEVENLLLILLLQRVAAQMGIHKITGRPITPPDENPYARLELEVKSVLPVLERVGQLGNWVARGTKLTWDVDAITSELIRRLMDKLS